MRGTRRSPRSSYISGIIQYLADVFPPPLHVGRQTTSKGSRRGCDASPRKKRWPRTSILPEGSSLLRQNTGHTTLCVRFHGPSVACGRGKLTPSSFRELVKRSILWDVHQAYVYRSILQQRLGAGGSRGEACKHVSDSGVECVVTIYIMYILFIFTCWHHYYGGTWL